jgi:ubiquinone/menaquinone biosynthesis C-methylase UbiE
MASDDIIREAFTGLAPGYEETMDRELRTFLGLGYGEFVDWLVEEAAIEEGDAVLDVATGTGGIPLKLTNKVGDRGTVVGLDVTPAMLGLGKLNIQANASPSSIRLICASGMEMPFAQGVFDKVICGFGTHHMDLPRVLSEMRRVLRPGGELTLVEAGASPLWRSFWGRALLSILLFGYGLAHRSARTRAEAESFSNIRTADNWHTTLSIAGFAQINITESQARRSWYPCALTIKAVTNGTQP